MDGCQANTGPVVGALLKSGDAPDADADWRAAPTDSSKSFVQSNRADELAEDLITKLGNLAVSDKRNEDNVPGFEQKIRSLAFDNGTVVGGGDHRLVQRTTNNPDLVQSCISDRPSH